MEKVLIFGASSRLAQMTANELAKKRSCEVRMVGHCRDAMESQNRRIGFAGNCDVTDWKQVNRVFRDCCESGFIPTAVINCTGVSGKCKITDMSYEEWRRVTSVNLDGAFNICQNAISFMKDNSVHSSIILIGSAYGIRHVSELSHYCTSKYAVSALARVLSVEAAQYNISINTVVPALFRSNMTEAFCTDGKYIDQLVKHYPANKLIDPKAVVKAIEFLVREKTASINGTEIIVDGGFINMLEGGIII